MSATSPLLGTCQAVGERQGVRLWGPLDLTLGRGRAVHVQGANGSGKTTLLRTLAGLRRPAAGRIVHGGPTWFIGHATPLADELDARSNLRDLLDLHQAEVDAARIDAWLTRQGLPARRAVRQLSAGQRRRITLAPLWLAPRPLWLLDEPFDALDQSTCEALARWSAAHLAGGGAIVLSSHQSLPAGFPRCDVLRLGAAAPATRPAGQELTP
ncbi:heme exporter protein A [Sphaerotilus hippei]|uniref:Heme exporter protein A n=1 Tax=Sphaerotilus hippei TaxID=744406 RepID=A0A318GV84_9BURK|nr:heme ABC exporter ATP-binding protein CcmA [Sphaerotilus hippei]PXW93372.1 heme exporter protein A [Sphaerotilus hippei]